MPASRRVRHLLEYAFLRAGVGCLRLLPLDLAVAVAGRLCALVAPLTGLHRRALTNLQCALPERSAGEHRRILAQMWNNTGKVIAETLMLDRITSDPGRIEVAERQKLEGILQAEGANIGLTLHLGNWELVAQVCAMCGGRLAAIYRPMRNPYIDRFIWNMRRDLYPSGLLTKGATGGEQTIGQATRFAIDFLRRNGHLGFVVDQVDDKSPFTVPFFGWESTFTPAPAMLARRIAVRLLVGRCLRVGPGSRFRFDFEEVAVPRTNSAEADIRNVTAFVAARFEGWIRETPEQWMWWQRRAIGVRRIDPDVSADGRATPIEVRS